MSTNPPARGIRGIRSSLPRGVIVGRRSRGDGPAELLSPQDIAQTILNTGSVIPGGAQLTTTAPGITGGGSLSAGLTLAVEWNAGTVSAIGSTLAEHSNTLDLAPIASGDVIANTDSVSGIPGPATVSAVLDRALASTQGDIIYRSGASWTVLGPGTSGQMLKTQGPAANPVWANEQWNAGSVTAVGTGLAISSTTLTPNWQAGTVATIGTGLTLTLGTLTATGSGGTVTSLTTAGAGISASPATITTVGTFSVEWNAGTVSALGSTGMALSGGTLTARQSFRLQAAWANGAIVNNDTIYFAFDPPYAGTINTLKYFCNTGSFTVAIKIAGTDVTSLSAVNVNVAVGSAGTATATGANTFAAGQAITGVITGATGSPADALLSINGTWNA